MLASRPRAEAVEAFEGDPRIPFIAAFEAQDLALCGFGAVARLVAELHGVAEAVDWRGTVERESEIARRIQSIEIGRCLLNMAQPPESFEPVKGQGRLDAERQLLLPLYVHFR